VRGRDARAEFASEHKEKDRSRGRDADRPADELHPAASTARVNDQNAALPRLISVSGTRNFHAKRRELIDAEAGKTSGADPDEAEEVASGVFAPNQK